MSDRRSFLRAAGLGMAAASLPGIAAGAVNRESAKGTPKGIKLGVASYTLRNFSTEQALDMTVRCGIDRMTFKSKFHLPLDSDKESIENALELCKSKGVMLYGAGVVKMRTEADVDQAFEYAKAAGMDMLVSDPSHELLKYIEGKVKKYDIKLAIHNHGPGDHQLYPAGLDAYNKLKDMDPRMGLCLDIGHTTRIDQDPIAEFRSCFDRVLDVHIKDVTERTEKGHACVIGTGVIDIVSFLKAVTELDYKGTLALEYEREADDPLPAMMACIGYVKGVLAAL